jgi:hypothetical protein
LYLISISYEDELQNNRRVCKKLPIFMAKGRPFNGKLLHTSNILNYGGQSIGVAGQKGRK